MALQGGAIALIGSSIIIVGQDRRYEFVNNSAVYKGGAIYVSQISNMDFISAQSYALFSLLTAIIQSVFGTGKIL